MRPWPALILVLIFTGNSTTAAVGVTGADLALDLHRSLPRADGQNAPKRRVNRCAGSGAVAGVQTAADLALDLHRRLLVQVDSMRRGAC